MARSETARHKSLCLLGWFYSSNSTCLNQYDIPTFNCSFKYKGDLVVHTVPFLTSEVRESWKQRRVLFRVETLQLEASEMQTDKPAAWFRRSTFASTVKMLTWIVQRIKNDHDNAVALLQGSSDSDEIDLLGEKIAACVSEGFAFCFWIGMWMSQFHSVIHLRSLKIVLD